MTAEKNTRQTGDIERDGDMRDKGKREQRGRERYKGKKRDQERNFTLFALPRDSIFSSSSRTDLHGFL